MIYLDCAATSLQKPRSVVAASSWAIDHYASPGRGNHRPAMRAADCTLDCRILLSQYFNVDDPEKVIFTFNATHALNIAISSLVSAGDKVVISGYEHNAVWRPLVALGANICIAEAPLFDPDASIEAFRKVLPGAKCCICNHVSNVFGFIQPLTEIAKLCHEFDVPLIVDASQSAGILPLDFTELDAAFIAMPGHKGLLGPQGTGVLLCNHDAQPILFGGTGSNSRSSQMPDFLPDRLEAGTHNVTGIAGLSAGVRYLASQPKGSVLSHEQALRECFVRRISDLKGITIYTPENRADQSGVVSIVPNNISCEEFSEKLGCMGICVRSGLHCAPLAHESAGTLESGTVRFSFSPFNTCKEVFEASNAVKKISESRR